MPVATLALLALLSVSSLPCVVVAGDGGARGGRPSLSGEEQQVSSADGLFTVHYTQAGDDRVQSVVDADGNGVVDSLDDILLGLETARSVYLERGYRPLVGDDGAGGSAAIDVYVVELANNGFANAVPAADGAEESSCYMRLAADLTGTGGELLESVAAHELHHCIQYRYTSAAASWLYEATATWEQYNLYNSGLLEVALAVLWGTRLSGAARPLDDVGARFEYAGFSWWKFWSEYIPTGEERLVPFWDILGEQPDWREALDSEAQRLWQLDLAGAFLEYATWNGFACGRDDGGHYDPASMPCLLEAASVPVEPLLVAEEAVVSLDPGSYTSAYLELAASAGDDAPRLQCSGPGDGAEALVRLIALDALGRRGAEISARVSGDDELDIQLDDALQPGGAALVVVASVGEEPTLLRCQANWVQPVVEEQAGCSCSAQPARGPPTGRWLGPMGLLLAWGRRRRAAPHAAAAAR
jgi:MYXO-CTERM domain-containing protein